MGSFRKFAIAVFSGFVLLSACGRSDFAAFDELSPLSGTGGTDTGGRASGGTSGSFTGGVSGTSGSFTGGVSGTGACGGLTPCAGVCVDLFNDPNHCGACFAQCPDGFNCFQGYCDDPCPGMGATLCSGVCTNTTLDPRNCGACGNVCPPGLTCGGGFCQMTPCPPGLLLCNGFCVNPESDPSNCGACGIVCGSRPFGFTCEEGECSCPGREVQCGADCVDLATDPLNCGSCRTRCADDQICADGVCRLDCPPEFTVCGEECRNLLTDPDNCGACGAACGRLEVCNNGRCDTSCGNLTSCNGICRDLEHDPRNCGSCGTVCPMGQVCDEGACSLVCGPGITNCSGTCRDLRVDPQNCGTCGNRCGAREFCSNGMCTTIPTTASYTVSSSPLMFVNACGQPGAFVTLPGVDDDYTTLMMPFVFRFYGIATQSAWVSSNGVVGFVGGSAAYGNQCSFGPGVPIASAILAYWDDLITRQTGVCIATIGSAPNRQFVATWNDAAHLEQSTSTHLTFSIVLNEGTDVIDVLYATMTGGSLATGASASIGLASASQYTLDCCNSACVVSNTGRRYTPR